MFVFLDIQVKREALASVLVLIADDSDKLGIYGFPICQDCGEVGYYQGLYGAMAAHATTKYGTRFSDITHEHTPSFDKAFCEVCRDHIRPAELLLCQPCQQAFAQYANEDKWPMMVKRFTKNRPRFHGVIAIGEFWEEINSLQALQNRNVSK